MRTCGVLLGSIGLSSVLVGCSSAPELPDETRIRLSRVVRQVRCEVYLATEKFSDRPGSAGTFEPWIKTFVQNLAIGYKVSLQVKDSDGINTTAASAAWGIPISFGLFSLKAAGGLNEANRRLGEYEAQFVVQNVWDEGPNVCNFEDSGSRPSRVNLDGTFGVDTWLERSVETRYEVPRTDEFKSIGTTIEFMLTPSIGVTPTWAIVRPGNRKFDGTLPISWQREFKNTLAIAITPNKPSPPPYSKVCVVNNEGECPADKARERASGRKGQAPRVPARVSPEAERQLQYQLKSLENRFLE